MNTEHTVLGLNASDWALLRILREVCRSPQVASLLMRPDIRSSIHWIVKKMSFETLNAAIAALGASEATDKVLFEKTNEWMRYVIEDRDVGLIPVENIVVVLMQDEECS